MLGCQLASLPACHPASQMDRSMDTLPSILPACLPRLPTLPASNQLLSACLVSTQTCTRPWSACLPGCRTRLLVLDEVDQLLAPQVGGAAF